MVPTTDFRRRAAEKTIQYLVLPAMLLAVWQVLFHTGFLRPMTLPPQGSEQPRVRDDPENHLRGIPR